MANIRKNLFLMLFVAFSSMLSKAFGQQENPYLSSKEIQIIVDNETVAWKLQNYAISFSKISNYKATMITQALFIQRNKANRNVPDKPKADSILFHSFKRKNALDVILKTSEKYKVVITNEAHYQPQNRVFTTLLLEKMYKKGFRYLCAEDFSYADTLLNMRKYPIQKSGYYINEPQYGNLAREALKIGYTLVPYEHRKNDADIKDPMERQFVRERGQAENIAQIFKKDANAKVLVHCGYGHLNENEVAGNGFMGYYLKVKFDIDPFTIDQVNQLEEENTPYYNWANVSEPSIYANNNIFFNNLEKGRKVDAIVFFPKAKYINNRPDWLVWDKKRKYFFPKLDNKLAFPLMLFVYHEGEDASVAIPTDIIEVNNLTDKIALVLQKGKYNLQIKDVQGNIATQKITVK